MTVSKNADSISIPAIDEADRDTSRWGGCKCYNLEEGGAKIASTITFRKMALRLSKKVGLIYCTDELLQDASLLEQHIVRTFANEMSWMIEKEILTGSGATGEFLGILNSYCCVEVAKKTGQKSGTFLIENVFDMMEAFCGDLSKAVWICSKSLFGQIANFHIAVGTGGSSVYLANAQAAPGQKIFGIPIIWHEVCKTAGTVGDVFLADMSHYLLVSKGSPVSAWSPHVRFLNDESIYRIVGRFAGQCDISQPIVSYEGDVSQSPFVKLATRS